MAFPNVVGLYLLAPTLRRALDAYWRKLNDGQFKVYA